jgi:O-antigen/teichoic acid export membrane protein
MTPETPAPPVRPRPRLGRNTVYNILGEALPLLVGLWAIPVLVRRLGTDRFGVLTIVWAVIGYFSLFDLGLGRALTKLVAERIGSEDEHTIGPLAWTGLLCMLGLGFIGACAVLASSAWLAATGLHLTGPLCDESTIAFRLLACSVPVVTVTAGLRGVLEAHQQFGPLNLAKAPLGVLVFAAPVAALTIAPTLVPVVAVLLTVRLLYCVALGLLCLRLVPPFRRIDFRRAELGPMLRFGGWMTVSNVIGPLLIYMDRVLIGFLLGRTTPSSGVSSTTEVAYYATPFEIVTRIWLVPASLQSVLFPAFARDLRTEKARAARVYERGLAYLFAALFPIILVVIALAPDGLRFWLGPEFASHGSRVAQWLAVGVFINGLANVPFGLLHGAGRPQWTALLHVLEMLVYLPILWVMVSRFGIEGAAVAWTLRVTVDAALLFLLAGRIVEIPMRAVVRGITVLVAALVTLWVGAILVGLVARAVYAASGALLFAVFAWYAILDRHDRARFLRRAPRDGVA